TSLPSCFASASCTRRTRIAVEGGSMHRLVTLALVTVFTAVGIVNAEATTIGLPKDGSWHGFDVADIIAADFGTEWIDLNDGSPLNFVFTIAPTEVGQLTIVDTGYAGDTFQVFNNGSALGTTSSVPGGVYSGGAGISDPDVALANALFSRITLI